MADETMTRKVTKQMADEKNGSVTIKIVYN